MNIAILGASGCVGQNLIKRLLDYSQYEVIAAYRKKEESEDLQHGRLTWRQVNLLDTSSAENFLRGADVLIYLIHSLARVGGSDGSPLQRISRKPFIE